MKESPVRFDGQWNLVEKKEGWHFK